MVDNWRITTEIDNPYKGLDGFKIWSSGDLMLDAVGDVRTVTSEVGNNWLELNSGRSLERVIETVAGAHYVLNLDSAAYLGTYANVNIYVDDVQVGNADSSSPLASLYWRSQQYVFVGTGGKQSIRIVADVGLPEQHGQSRMISRIALKEMLPTNVGFKDSSIHLSAITARLQDTDGSERLSLNISGLPVGSVLTDGSKTFTAQELANSANVTDWYLTQLRLTPPKGFIGNINLQIIATTTERGNGSKATSTVILKVTVLNTDSDHSALNLTSPILYDKKQNVSDVMNDVVSNKQVINHVNVINDEMSPETMSAISYMAGSVKTDTTNLNQNLIGIVDRGVVASLPVTQRNSAKQSGLMTQTLSLVITSKFGNATRTSNAISNNAEEKLPQTIALPRIYWSGSLPEKALLFKSSEDEWLLNSLGLSQSQQTLAEQTGLIVRKEK